MVFAHPQWLWLLVLAPLLAVLDMRGGGSRRLASALLRAACVAALILALARPLLPWRNAESTTVAVFDLGDRVSDAALAKLRGLIANPPPGRLPIVVFSARAEVLSDPRVLDDATALAALRERLVKPQWADDLNSGGTNLADAIRLAGTLIPVEGHGQIRLFTGGRNDHGDAAAESWRLAKRGIDVKVEPTDVIAAGPFRVRSLELPATARVGQTVHATINLESTIAAKATLRLTAGDAQPITVPAEFTPGVNTVTVELPLNKARLTQVHLEAQATDGSPAAVAEGTQSVFVNPPASVLLVQSAADGGDAPDAGLAAAASALLGSGVDVHSVTPSQLAESDPAAADAIILADVPADRLSAAAQASIRRAVGRGTGLLVAGAARSFGPGGYDDSPLASLLPVKMPQQLESIDPSTTLVLIIDTSGSMSGDRIDLAKEVARLAISHLKPHDKVGIVEFYGGKRWAAPIQSAGNLSVIHRALDRLTAGGGTTLYPAVEEASFSLRNVHTRSKHVLICSDGFVENAPFSTLVRQMADDGIVVSTVQVAADSGGPNQMPDIARWGNGRFYTVPDQFALPDLSFKQPQMSLTSPLVRTPSAVVAGEDPLVRAVTGTDVVETVFGTVGGYVRTQAKPTADVLLRAGAGDPLLARWRYGAGYVAVLPTQLGSLMTGGLQDKPAFAALLAGLVRQIGDNRGPPLRITTTVRPAGIEANVTAVDGTPSSGTLRVTLTDDSGHVLRTVMSEAMTAGHWNVLLPDVTAGAYTLGVSVLTDAAAGDSKPIQCEAGVSVPRPTPLVAIDHELLNRVAAFGPLAIENAAALPPARADFFDAQKALAAAAAVLLLTHLAVRRWPVAGGRAFPALVS